MNLWKTTACISVGATALALVGCDIFLGGRPRDDRAFVQAQPAYVEQQPGYVIVQQAPPPLIVESQPPPPSPDSIWIDGYWNWDNQRYSWQAGRYTVPPQPGVVWIAPRYDKDAHGYRYTPGQWKKQNRDNGRGSGGH